MRYARLLFILFAGLAAGPLARAGHPAVRPACVVDLVGESSIATTVPPTLASAVAPTSGPPPILRSLFHARTKIENHRLHLKRYLDPASYARLDDLLILGERRLANVDEVVLPKLTEIFERAIARFTDEFHGGVPPVETTLRSLALEADRLGHASLKNTLEQLITQLKSIAKRVNFTLGAELWEQTPRTIAEARLILTAVNEQTLHPPPRPLDVVDSLTVLGSDDLRNDVRRAVATAFEDPESVARELRRLGKRALGYRDVYAHVPNLNRALSFLIAPPRLAPCESKVCLVGMADVLGTPREVTVTLDPRERYFTVQAPARRYYRLVVEPDGRLRFLDAPVITMDACGKHLSTTHFGY